MLTVIQRPSQERFQNLKPELLHEKEDAALTPIALGFANTVDYEMEWDARHIESLVRKVGLRPSEIHEMQEIRSLKDLLSSILFHMAEGSGCGMLMDDPAILEAFIAGTRGKTTLGGTNIRAALAIAELGGEALVHLVSVNPETTQRLPDGIRWVGGAQYRCCYPHAAIQYPVGASVRCGDACIVAPRSNRVIYSADVACAMLPIEPRFFEELGACRILVLSSFDLVRDEEILLDRLSAVRRGIDALRQPRPLIFYEHAHFASPAMERKVLSKLGGCMDVFSMNEDEFSALIGRRPDLLDAADVASGLSALRAMAGNATLVVHSQHWVLAHGARAAELIPAMQGGMDVSATRYRCGGVSPETIAQTRLLPRQPAAEDFARKLQLLLPCTHCLPAYRITDNRVTTVGLGDSFVGGFALAYCRK